MSQSLIDDIAKQKDLYRSYEEVDEKMTWCGGCGNYGIQRAVFAALALANIAQNECIIAYDVGCSGNESDKLGAHTIHGLHGRVLPLATGIALANSAIKVIAHAGDGATFSEGVNHLVHAIRNNAPVLFILHQNGNYGLTTGQASATSKIGQIQTATPDGVQVPPINVADFIISLKPAFFARSWSGDLTHMTTMIGEGLKSTGFAVVEILQSCPTYNKVMTHEWMMEHVMDIGGDTSYDPSDFASARNLASTDYDKFPIGILYKNNTSVPLLDMIPSRAGKKTSLIDEVRRYDIEKLVDRFV